jgi:hypothetical protein
VKCTRTKKCWAYLYVVMLLHSDVFIERSGRIRFGGVVKSWNIPLGQRSLAESAAGISSSMIEMIGRQRSHEHRGRACDVGNSELFRRQRIRLGVPLYARIAISGSRTQQHPANGNRSFLCCSRPSERVAKWHFFPCGAL